MREELHMSNALVRKSLVIGIIILFLVAGIVPGISSKISDRDVNERLLNTPSEIKNQDISSLTFHTFDKTEEKTCNVELPTHTANYIHDILEELKYKIVYEPKSDETKNLKIEFVELLDEYGLIPMGLSKSDVLSLLNPSWLNDKPKTQKVKTRVPLLRNFILRILRNIVDLQQAFKNRFENTVIKNIIKNNLISPSSAGTATATFCSISSGGSGSTLPLFLLPRPRAISFWTASSAITSVGELHTAKGFVAGGSQTGTMLGFMGMGLTYAFPTETLYGFVGYALYTKVKADSIDFYPPNQPPVISDENPPSGTSNVPISLSELSFRISDPDGDRMDYTVTTDPNVGSGSGNNKQNGVYTVSISDLEYEKIYRWNVEVTDGNFVVEKEFSFITEELPPPVFDPFDEGWQYRKKITIDHLQVAGSLTYFPVLINIVDIDLRDKAQDDGDDILFMDDSGVASQLYHEIEYFDDSTGELVAWVRIPSLSNIVDTDFYMYYGNPGCSNQQFPEKVWDSNYLAVYHMNDPSGGIMDSTRNNMDGTEVGDPTYNVNGISDNPCIDCDGDVDGFDIPNTFGIRTTDFALEAWSDWDGPSPEGDSHLVYMLGEACVRIYHRGSLASTVFSYHNTVTWYEPVFNVTDSSGSWHYYCGVYDNDVGGFAYYDGALANSDAHNGNLRNDPQDNAIASPALGEGGEWNGRIDEVRISNIVRSSAWIETSYNTMNDPSSFFSVGPEESAP